MQTVPGYFFAPPAPDQDYAKSFPFLSHVNTRTIIFIEADNPSIGQVALVFVGLTEVSSCMPTIKEGQLVKKGEEIGHFAFDGSTCCILFDRKKIAALYISDDPTSEENELKVRQKIAIAL